MPVALVLTLRPALAAQPHEALGRTAHAAVLDLIREVAPALAESLHAESQLRPLAVTPPYAANGQSLVQVVPTQHYALRIASTSAELDEILAGWEAQPPATLPFGGVAWHVVAASSDPREPWGGRASYAALVQAGTAAASRGEDGWLFEFGAPIMFRRSGLTMPLPLPELVFGSLFDRWNAFAPLPLPMPELRELVTTQVAVGRIALTSVSIPTKNSVPQVACVGQCGYRLTTANRPLAAVLATLARFARYSGVGAASARGFGMTRLREG